MVFARRIREGVERGEIRCSVRIWQRPHVKAGHRYAVGAGEIVVESILPISLEDVTPELARESGFKGVVDLLKVAKHGPGENVFLVRFRYVPGAGGREMAAKEQTIDAYLAGLAPQQRQALAKLRQAIRAAAPGAEECFSYGMPAFRLGKTLIAGFSASARHCAFYPMSGRTIGTLGADLAGYDTSKGAVRFSTDRVLPATLVRKLVKTRIAEAAASDAKAAKSVAKAAGYSGTPLSRKLGLREGSTVLVLGAPDGYEALLAPLPAGVAFVRRLSARVDLVHLFSTRSVEIARQLATVREGMRKDAAVWVSWPKKAAKVPTDVTEDTIREIALPLDLVDVKVCAVDDQWSGLKLVIRRASRPA